MPNITKEPASLVVEEGGDAAIDCVTEGLPKPRVYWVFNGHTVHEDGNIQIIGMKNLDSSNICLHGKMSRLNDFLRLCLLPY